MPPRTFIVLLLTVIIAAAVTVWGLFSGGAPVMAIALPAFLIATLALQEFRK